MRAAAAAAFGPLSVAALALALLAPFAGFDPARGVTFSNAPFSDEAWNLMGARNLVVFGHPSTDEWRTWLFTLPFTAIQAAALALFGVDLVVARLVMISTVAVTGAVIAWGLAAAVGTLRAWIAGIAYVTSALVLYYGRLVFLEPMVGAFLALGTVTLVRAPRGRPLAWGLVGGAALAFAVLTKAVAAVAVGGVVAVVVIAGLRIEWARRWGAGAVASGSSIAVAWGLLVLLPRPDDVRTVIEVIYPPFGFPRDLGELVQLLANFPFEDGVLPMTFPLLVLAVVGITSVAREARGHREGPAAVPGGHLVPVAAFVGLVGGLLLTAIVTYQPNRYVVAFLPLAAIAGAWALPARLGSPGWRWLALRLALIVAVAAQGVVLQGRWMRDRASDLARMQAAGATLPAGAIVVGQYAPLIAFESPARTIVPFETVNDHDWYDRGARYLVWVDGGPWWMARHPEAWAERRVLDCFVWGVEFGRTCLYEVP